MWSNVRRCVAGRAQLGSAHAGRANWGMASRVGVFLLALGTVEVAVATAGATVAQAAESPAVEALLERGIELRRQGSDSEALKLFRQAEAKAPRSVRAMLHVATAAQAAGKWVMASAYLKKVSRYSNDPYYRRYRDSIAQVERAIAQRVGDFQAIGGPDGAIVTLDGRRIGTLPMAGGVPMEAGTYTVEVSLDGYYPFTRSVVIAGGSLARESVRLNELPEEEKLALARALRPVPEWWESSWLTWTLAGVGVLGGAASGAAYVLREDEATEYNSVNCLPPVEGVAGYTNRRDECGSKREDIRTLDAVLIAGGTTAAVFGSMALVQWLATGRSATPEDGGKKPSPASASIQCGPGLTSILCQGSF